MLVASDKITDKDFPAASLVKGDIFMIVGATLYGISRPFILCVRLHRDAYAACLTSERDRRVFCPPVAPVRGQSCVSPPCELIDD